MQTTSTPVLIVGGGLAGLSTALLLAWYDVPCVLVERHPGTSTHPRARGVNPRTMELLRSVGLEQPVRTTRSAAALAGNSGIVAVETLTGRQLGTLAQSYFVDPTQDLGTLSPCGWALCDQDELEPLLRQRALELGADLRFATELVDLEVAPAPTALLRDGLGGAHALRARYVVAADGARSRVREQLGVAARGPGVLARYCNIHFRAHLGPALGDRRFILCYVVNPRLMGALIPIDNRDDWLLHVLVPEGDPRGVLRAGPSGWAELVRAAVGVEDLPVEVHGALPWESAGLAADSLRVGDVFLVGDAAHVMPPSGAFGSNTGIQDAHNLAWKLAAVHHGHADPALLDSYDAERRPVATATMEQAVLRSQDRPRLVTAAAAPAPAGIQPDHVVMFGYRYGDDGVWAPGRAGVPGMRAPHLAVEVDGRRRSSLDLHGRDWMLLAGPHGGAWRGAASAAPLPLVAHVLGEDVVDVEGRWWEVFGADRAEAVLIRPDGFVAARSGGLPADPARWVREALAAGLALRPARTG